MATLNSLKQSLRQKAKPSSSKKPLSDTQYSAGFDILVSGGTTYQDFIIPQLSQLLSPLFNSRIQISVLEIGPGAKSVLGHLPDGLRQKITRYVAYEPNALFSTGLEEGLKTEPLPCLDSPADIHRIPFTLDSNTSDGDEKFDVVLFCHSMYGMKLKDSFISRALERLSDGGMVVVVHCDGTLHLNGLVCHRTASFPTGVIRVADDDETLDCFATFVAGFDVDEDIRVEWRQVCRALGRREEAHPDQLLFSAPDMVATFTRHATAVAELRALVPLGAKEVKNREARLHCPAANVRPTEVQHVQQVVRWALEHGVGLTVVGGGHSGHCLVSNVVSVDMGAFDQVHIIKAGEEDSTSGSLVVAEAGSKTGDIIRKTMEAGMTVPLGSRPSVGAGSWLQGGIGHDAGLLGLACDAIVGAVVVNVGSGEILVIGRVPSQHIPAGAVRPDNEHDLLWAMRGAGTNFGIVVSITFKPYRASTYLVRNWVVPLGHPVEALLKLKLFDRATRSLSPTPSADAYLYWDADQLHLGVTMYEFFMTRLLDTTTPKPMSALLGLENSIKTVDGVGLFDTEMYMSAMHGGHAGGKTSSFKRCLFLKDIGAARFRDILLAAIDTRPSPLCYLHLLQGGGTVSKVPANATAFGNRDWDFACVITGVWPRHQDETEVARAAVGWVYNVAADLLPLSNGAYGADLGPDPRDAALAAKAFGPNLPRLARLKQTWDPRNVLAYACPLPKPMEPKLIILVTGEICAGKDFCASMFASVFTACNHTARVVRISDVTKQEYAMTYTGVDLYRLLCDRGYKEQRRPALTAFWQDQVRRRPRLPEEHFLREVYGAVDVDVLIITGMRDQAPVATLSHLVPDSRLIEVRVEASEEIRRARGHTESNPTVFDHRPNLTFTNNAMGPVAARRFAENNLIPFFDPDLRRLLSMIRPVPDFPRPGIEFRHVLDISQQPGGLALVTSLLENHFSGDWTEINRIACVEAGSFVFASAFASFVDVPLALIRNAGKLPPPTVSVVKPRSHILSAGEKEKEERIEMDRDVVPRGAKVVLVDDVLATGKTLVAVLELLGKAGVGVEDISIMVVAEFPLHRGRELLRQAGFGRVNIQSLVVIGGA